MSNGISPPLTIGSTVDRTIHQTYPQSPTSTPSSKTCPPDIELLHRLNGTSILAQTTTLLRLSASAYATSTAIFHRFYHRQSLEEFDVWSTSMGCVILACKIEEEIKRVSEVILVFVHVYRRMRLAIDYSDDDGNGNDNENDSDDSINQMKKLFQTASCSLLQSKKLTQEERKNILRYVKPLPRTGPVYREWEEELLRTENVILRELGFSLYWIPESHPHVFLLYFMKVLELVDEGKDNDKDNDEVKTGHDIKVDEGNGKGIAQVAWNYCNDSCRLDFCVRYEPELIACAAIYLASLHRNRILPMEPRPWWHAFIGPGHDEGLSNVCNALLALRDGNCIAGYKDAMQKYVISLVDGGSFSDPGSYIWNTID